MSDRLFLNRIMFRKIANGYVVKYHVSTPETPGDKPIVGGSTELFVSTKDELMGQVEKLIKTYIYESN